MKKKINIASDKDLKDMNQSLIHDLNKHFKSYELNVDFILILSQYNSSQKHDTFILDSTMSTRNCITLLKACMKRLLITLRKELRIGEEKLN